VRQKKRRETGPSFRRTHSSIGKRSMVLLVVGPVKSGNSYLGILFHRRRGLFARVPQSTRGPGLAGNVGMMNGLKFSYYDVQDFAPS